MVPVENMPTAVIDDEQEEPEDDHDSPPCFTGIGEYTKMILTDDELRQLEEDVDEDELEGLFAGDGGF